MEILINNKNYHLSYGYGFPEKLSDLKKLKTIKLQFECDKDTEPDYNDFFIVSKSNYYYWGFINCKVVDKIYNIKEYTFYHNNRKKVEYIIIEFSFENVIGSNNKSLIEREIKLNQLLK